MITTIDLQKIGKLFDERLDFKLEEKLESKLEQKLEQKLEEKLSPIRKDIRKLINHDFRLQKLEENAGLIQTN